MDIWMGLSNVLVVAAALVALASVLWNTLELRRERRDLGKVADAVLADTDARGHELARIALDDFPVALTDKQSAALIAQIGQAVTHALRAKVETTIVETLVSSYHTQALGQARVQFWFSTAAATLGFGLIWYGAFTVASDISAGLSKCVTGVVTDAVAYLFFRQASEIRQRATDLYDRLRRDRRGAESVAVVASIEDLRVRNTVRAQLALHMAGLDPIPIDLTAFLSVGERTLQTADSNAAAAPKDASRERGSF